MEKKINKKKLSLLISGIIVVVVVICMLIFKIVVGSNKIKDINEQSKKVDEVTEVKKESITINFVGDITMGNYKGASYYGSFDNEFENQGQDYGYFLKNVKKIFEEDDLTVANLEGPLTSASNAKVKKFAFIRRSFLCKYT